MYLLKWLHIEKQILYPKNLLPHHHHTSLICTLVCVCVCVSMLLCRNNNHLIHCGGVIHSWVGILMFKCMNKAITTTIMYCVMIICWFSMHVYVCVVYINSCLKKGSCRNGMVNFLYFKILLCYSWWKRVQQTGFLYINKIFSLVKERNINFKFEYRHLTQHIVYICIFVVIKYNFHQKYTSFNDFSSIFPLCFL